MTAAAPSVQSARSPDSQSAEAPSEMTPVRPASPTSNSGRNARSPHAAAMAIPPAMASHNEWSIHPIVRDARLYGKRPATGLEPSSPRTFEPSNPRTFEPSNLRTCLPSVVLGAIDLAARAVQVALQIRPFARAQAVAASAVHTFLGPHRSL